MCKRRQTIEQEEGCRGMFESGGQEFIILAQERYPIEGRPWECLDSIQPPSGTWTYRKSNW